MMKRSRILILLSAMLLCCSGCARNSAPDSSVSETTPVIRAELPQQLTAAELEQQGIVLEYDSDDRIKDIDGDFAGFPIENDTDAMQAVASLSDLLGCKDVYDELRIYRKSEDPDFCHYFFVQYYKGIPINSHRTNLHVRADSKRVIDLQNSYFPDLDLNTEPDVSAEAAKEAASASLPGSEFGTPELIILVHGNTPQLVWNFLGTKGEEVQTDAHTGKVLYAFNGIYED